MASDEDFLMRHIKFGNGRYGLAVNQSLEGDLYLSYFSDLHLLRIYVYIFFLSGATQCFKAGTTMSANSSGNRGEILLHLGRETFTDFMGTSDLALWE